MRARQWTLANYPDVETRETDFALVERDLASLAPGEALVRADVVGLAPSLRFRMTRGGAGLPGMALGDPIVAASGVGTVLASRRDGIREGDLVYGDLGWADYANVGAGRYLVAIGRAGEPLTNPRAILGETSTVTGGTFLPEDYLGRLGGGGAAAWVGLQLTQARAGETIVVTAAAGGIGSLACRIAAIMGLDVVAITRTPEKVTWIREMTGATTIIAADDPADVLRELPHSYDVLFDNVGGNLLQPLLGRIAKYGRVALCGLIAEYESGETTPLGLASLVFRNVTLAGYFADDHLALWGPAFDAIARWMIAGRISRADDVAHGVENFPATYLRLFRGRTNRGRLMLRPHGP